MAKEYKSQWPFTAKFWKGIYSVQVNDGNWYFLEFLWAVISALALKQYSKLFIHLQMSKQTGNFLTLTDAVNKFSADGKKLNLLFTIWYLAALIVANTVHVT